MPPKLNVQKSNSTGLYAPGAAHFNQALTSVAINYVVGSQRLPGFVSDQVFPTVYVQNQSDQYWVLDDEHLRDSAEARAPGTESAGAALKLSDGNYFCKVYGWHVDVPDQLRANADSVFALDDTATRAVMGVHMLRREISWAQQFFNPDAWAYHVDGASAATAAGSFDPTTDDNNKVFWDDPASTPIEDIRQGQRIVGEGAGGGFRPNTLVLARPVFDVLLDHPDIVARLDRGQTPGRPAMANREALAAILELERVLVMDAVYNASMQGRNNRFVQGNGALLAYAAPNPSLMDASAGYTFAWSGYSGAENRGIRVRKFRMEHLESDRVEGGQAFDHRVTAPRLGYFFDNIVQHP